MNRFGPGCCCRGGGCADMLGLTLYLTDSNGTHALTEVTPDPDSVAKYTCCYYLAEVEHTTAQDVSAECEDPLEDQPGTIAVGYEVGCYVGIPDQNNVYCKRFAVVIPCTMFGEVFGYRYRRADEGAGIAVCTGDGGTGPPAGVHLQFWAANYTSVTWKPTFSADFTLPATPDYGGDAPNPFNATVVVSE